MAGPVSALRTVTEYVPLRPWVVLPRDAAVPAVASERLRIDVVERLQADETAAGIGSVRLTGTPHSDFGVLSAPTACMHYVALLSKQGKVAREGANSWRWIRKAIPRFERNPTDLYHCFY